MIKIVIMIHQFIKKQKLFIASLGIRRAPQGGPPHRACLRHEEMTQKRISAVWDKWLQA